MYNNKKEIKISVTIEYDYSVDESKIKEIIKDIIELNGVKTLEIENKK